MAKPRSAAGRSKETAARLAVEYPGDAPTLCELSFETPFRTSPLPATITQAMVDDPNTMLRDALQGQTLTHITRLIVTTENAGGVSNIPFITTNANTQVVESVFAIERVKGPDGIEVLQLQYSQTAQLDFGGMSWPHVTVGTLIRAF